ncbi:MAG: radical SAM protein, partial [Clostridia bacterium]|nr:radical SAM protein [Clostridia bacterium]
MLFDSKILKYAKNNLTGVLHTTLNPEGPGVVRIHLVPPKTDGKTLGASVAIINGQDIIPVNSSWTIVLAEFIKEVNKYAGKELSDADVESIINQSCKGVKKVFPLVSKKLIKSDLYKIMKSFTQIAYGQPVTEHIEYLSLTDYADRMQAPHRMDLLVSAMAKDKAWNCNQKCVHCYAAGQTLAEEKELSTDEWKVIIDKCKEACIPQLTFTGGEPTMRDDLVELIDYSQWFVTRLNTNGIKLTKEL